MSNQDPPDVRRLAEELAAQLNAEQHEMLIELLAAVREQVQTTLNTQGAALGQAHKLLSDLY